MSKLEKAIRQAGRQHEAMRREKAGIIGDDEIVLGDDLNSTNDRLLPVKYRIKALCRHNPSSEVLSKHRIIHEGFAEDALLKYKMLRTTILQDFSAHNWKTLAVTSPNESAGKTVTAINLAISLASQSDLDVFLIDLNLRNPSIADYFDLPSGGPGLSAYYDKQVELSDILWDVGINNLVVLASRDRIANSSERLTSKRMQELVKIFRSGSPRPIVVMDLPPVLSADDAIAISPLVDAMLLVAAEGETSRSDLSQALEMLKGVHIVGTVLNKVRSY